MYYKRILLFIAVVAILIMVISYVNSRTTPITKSDRDVKIVYRYIPRTYQDDNVEPVFVSDVFKKMFEKESPWIRSIREVDYDAHTDASQYFISQS